MIAIKAYPVHRVEVARAELEKAHRRMVRAAARAGQEPPAAPALAVTREYVSSKCRCCGQRWEGTGPCPDGFPYAPCGPVRRAALVDLELQAPPARLAGWDFLAVVEPLDGGNLIRQVPGATVAEGELDAWRTGPIGCDHCNATRHRKETFILRSETGALAGSPRSGGVPLYKQVGRTCLAAFLGGRSAADIVARLGWADLVRVAAGEEGEGGARAEQADVYEPVEFLSWCCSIARLDGFVTRKMAETMSAHMPAQSTSSKVELLLGDPPGNPEACAIWADNRERYYPQAEDRERAAAVLAWARALPGASDYEQNLQLVASQETLRPKHAGILASAVPAYERVVGERLARAARGPGEHYGKVGERYELELTVERVVPIATDYGAAVIATMRDVAGRAFMWRTAHAPGAVGDRVQLRGSVKRHSEYKGEMQTELTRCKITRTGDATT